MTTKSTDQCRTRAQCPDCDQCQVCSQSRCRLCRKGGHGRGASELGGAFTHGQYLAWKKKRSGVPMCCGAERGEKRESCARDHKT